MDSHPVSRVCRKPSWPSILLWTLVIIPVLAAAAHVSLVVKLLSEGALEPPASISVSDAPLVRETRLQAELAEIESELAPTPTFLDEALAVLSSPVQRQFGGVRSAVAFLRQNDIPASRRAEVVDVLLSGHAPLTPDALEALAKVGGPADAKKLLRVADAPLLPACLDVLERWNAPLDEGAAHRLLQDPNRSRIFAHELFRRDWITKPVIVKILGNGNVPPDTLPYFNAKLSESDWLVIRFIARNAQAYPLTEEMAKRLLAMPPAPALYQLFQESFASAALDERLLPAMFALDDPWIYEKAAEAISKSFPKNASDAKLADRDRLASRLVFELERTARADVAGKAALARMLAALSNSFSNDHMPWAVWDLASREPDIAKFAGVEPPMETIDLAASPDAIHKVLLAISAGDAGTTNAALGALAKSPVNDDFRAKVTRALRPHLFGSSPQRKARLEFCRWAGPPDETTLVEVAIASCRSDQPSTAAAVKALTRIASRRVVDVARSLQHVRWSHEVRSAWESSGDLGEQALCVAAAERRSEVICPPCMETLGRIGGQRSKILLTSLLNASMASELNGDAAARRDRRLAPMVAAIHSITRRLESQEE